MLSIIKTLFEDIKKVSDYERKKLLLLILVVYVLNFVGIYRNSYTLWNSFDAWSYCWLASDIIQLTFCSFLFAIAYFKEKLSSSISIGLAVVSAVLLVANIFNFVVNFYWLPYEGVLTFIFWFLNNGSMIAFCSCSVYALLISKRYHKA